MSGYLIGPCGVAPAVVAGGTTFAVDQTSTQSAAGPGNSTWAFTLPAIQANSLCVVSFVEYVTSDPVVSVVDTTNSVTWTFVQDGTHGGLLAYAFYPSAKVAGASLLFTLTTGASSGFGFAFASFTGASSLQLDSGASFTQGGTNTPTWTTSVAKTLAVGAIGPNNGNTLTPSTSGWVAISATGLFDNLVYKITSSALAAETLGSDGSGGYFSSVLQAFK